MSDDRRKQLLDLLGGIDDTSPPAVQQEIFNFIRKWWASIGESPDIRDKVCERLKLTPQMFNLLVMNPEIVYGEENLNKNLKAGWLKDYVYYTAGHEAPEDFHVWVGLTTVGSCIRRKAWFDNVFYNMYPNLYTILVSPPGIGKKTTAINIGAGILREADPECRIVAEKVTPEALAKILSKPSEHATATGGLKIEASAEGLLLAPELTVFLGREQYNEGLILFLTRLYDSADIQETETISRGKEKLRNVCISLLGATTPSEINNAIGKVAKGSGFMSRLNIIQKETTPRVVPFAVKPDKTVREMLINGLQQIIRDVKGEFTYTPMGREWYVDYYKRHNQAKQVAKKASDNMERQPDHLLKIAMIMSACERRDMLIDEDILQRCFNLLSVAAKNCGETLRMIDATERGKMAQRALQILREHGGFTTRSILVKGLYRYGISGPELDVIMNTLIDAGLVHQFFTGDAGRTRAYRLDKLEDADG